MLFIFIFIFVFVFVFVFVYLISKIYIKEKYVDNELYNKFLNYIKTQKKQYDVKDLQKRYNIFQKNFELCKYKEKALENPFLDITNDEFKNSLSGINIKNFQQSPIIPPSEAVKILFTVPAFIGEEYDICDTFNPFGKSILTDDIANQAPCDTCWAFSTKYCIDSALYIYNNDNTLPPFDISTQQIIDCFGLACNAGYFIENVVPLFDQQLYLFPHDKDYPYNTDQTFTAADGRLRCQHNKTICNDQNNYFHLYNKLPISIPTLELITLPPGSSALLILKALKKFGAIFAGYFGAFTSSFQNYPHHGSDNDNGIYTGNIVFDTNVALGHALTIVGFKTIKNSTGIDIWCVRCRNTWGSGWGYGGYVYFPFTDLLDKNIIPVKYCVNVNRVCPNDLNGLITLDEIPTITISNNTIQSTTSIKLTIKIIRTDLSQQFQIGIITQTNSVLQNMIYPQHTPLSDVGVQFLIDDTTMQPVTDNDKYYYNGTNTNMYIKSTKKSGHILDTESIEISTVVISTPNSTDTNAITTIYAGVVNTTTNILIFQAPLLVLDWNTFNKVII